MPRILVLCGGDNHERRVSLSGGDAVARGLAAAGHDVMKLDTAAPNRLVPHDQPLLDGPVGLTPPDEIAEARLDRAGWLRLIETLADPSFDAVLPLLHGTWGEGGQIQAVLELLGRPFLGCDMRASALALDKTRTHQVASLLGITLPRAVLLRVPPGDDAARRAAREYAVAATTDPDWGTHVPTTPHPVVLKPNFGGSTVGLTISSDPDALVRGLDQILSIGDQPLLEAFVPGREVTVPIVGEDALPMIEIVPHEGHYDYANKYTKGRTDYLCPAPVDEAIQADAARQATTLFAEMGGRHLARVDFRLTDHGELVLLEVNTIPGMTDLSLVPMAAKQAGMDFQALMDRFVQLMLG